MCGKLKVTLMGWNNDGDITERKLEVKDECGGHRIVSVLQLTSWPPGELPHPSAILSLIDQLSKIQRSNPSKHTIIMCRLDDFCNDLLDMFILNQGRI